MIGMAVAIIATLLGSEVRSYGFIIAGVVAGGLIGTTLAMRIRMTAMRQLVAALHSFVGLAAVLVAIGLFSNKRDAGLLGGVDGRAVGGCHHRRDHLHRFGDRVR